MSVLEKFKAEFLRLGADINEDPERVKSALDSMCAWGESSEQVTRILLSYRAIVKASGVDERVYEQRIEKAASG